VKFSTIDNATVKPPRRLTQDQIEADVAVRALRETGRALAVEVGPEEDERKLRVQIARAATRAGVKVRSWYSVEDAKVYVQLKA
jgi:YbbR domain-containing protein